jgi:hypothetical protein
MLQSKIDKPYEKHDCSRICQGDILRDYTHSIVSASSVVEELSFPYLIVVTQDCDLQQCFKALAELTDGDNKINPFLPHVLVIPAFPAEQAREGTHLTEIFKITQDRINSYRWNIISDNKEDRYHFLPNYQPLQVPNLLLDFKTYFTIDTEDLRGVFPKYYLATINELFREHLSQSDLPPISRTLS